MEVFWSVAAFPSGKEKQKMSHAVRRRPDCCAIVCTETIILTGECFKRQLSASSIPFHSDWQIDLENEWPLSDSIRRRCSLQDRGNTPLLFLSSKVPITFSLCLSILHRQNGIGIEFHFHWTKEQLDRCFQYYTQTHYNKSSCMFTWPLRPQVLVI